MKIQCCLLFVFTCANLLGQGTDSVVHLPMKDGVISYAGRWQTDRPLPAGELYKRAYGWFIETFSHHELAFQLTDSVHGRIQGSGSFPVLVKGSQNLYYVKPTITIQTIDGGYSMRIYDFYEKPMTVGVSHEYAKIGYRWWDYRQGHPWTSDDQWIFKGLDEHSTLLMESLKTVMNR